LLLTRLPLAALGISLKTLAHYRDVSDLKGRRIGMLGPSPTAGVLAETLLRQAGLRWSDVVQVFSDNPSDLLERYRQGHLDALSVNDPWITLLEQRGEIRIVADARSLRGSRDVFGGGMPGEVLCAAASFVRQQAAVCQALVHALVRSLKWLQTAGPSDLIKAVPDPHFEGDRGVYLAAFEKLREGFSSDGLMPVELALTALQAVARIDKMVRPERFPLERTYTNEFVQKAKARLRV
jgi:NitT/TauT family transport system substrate-binding protein